jgi:hypothetical protein
LIKIKNKDGLFSKGGYNPYFTKNGKSWILLGHVINHFRNLDNLEVYKDCVLEIFNEEELTKSTLDIKPFIEEFIQDNNERLKKIEINRLNYDQDHIKREIAKLEQKFKDNEEKLSNLIKV